MTSQDQNQDVSEREEPGDQEQSREQEGKERPVRAVGIVAWFAVLCGIVAWMIHIILVASFVEFICNTSDAWLWVLHAATVVTAGATVLAMWLCLRLMRLAGAGEEAGDLAGSTYFLGLFGLITGALSLALILLEGSYVLFIDPCA